MTLYAFYTRREFDAQEEAEALGLTCYVPRRVDLIRQGKRRRPDAVIRPYLPNYVFVETDAHGWHMLRDSKHLRTWMGISDGSAKQVMAFIGRVEADFAARMAQIEAGERVSEYAPGDLLQIIAGPFQGQLARFKRIAEGAIFPEVVAEADIMGQAVTIRLDPLAAKRAVA
jgi:transcription antitermination factor NusG